MQSTPDHTATSTHEATATAAVVPVADPDLEGLLPDAVGDGDLDDLAVGDEPPPQDPTDEAVDGAQDVDEGEGATERRIPRTPDQIVKHSLSITSGYGGLCLKFVRTCANIPGLYGSAKKAWANAKHKHTDGVRNAPKGAFVFLSHPKSQYGHVAIYLGNNKIRTTNSTTKRIHSDPIATWTGWGYTLQGWSEDINGVRIPGLQPAKPKPKPKPNPQPKPTPKAAEVLRVGSRGPAVRALQQGLNRTFPAYSKLALDSSYGPLTKSVVAEFQRRSGLRATGEVDAATRAALNGHGVRW